MLGVCRWCGVCVFDGGGYCIGCIGVDWGIDVIIG